MMSIKTDVSKSAGSLQTCAGQEAGIEATIHAVRELFENDSNEGMIIIDASNAFNSVNREAFLHNIKIICPPLSLFTFNCCATKARLFVICGLEILSSEGTTQGDPIAMVVYGIAIIPMIMMMVEMNDESDDITRIAGYADDISATGKLKQLRRWLDKISKLGPKFGYYPQNDKSWLIVKPELYEEAKKIFSGTKINITTEGRKYLGGVIGTDKFKTEYVDEKIEEMIKQLERFCKIAMYEPQAAYSAFIFGFKHKITYLMRCIPNISCQLEVLDEIILTKFIPTTISNGVLCSLIDDSEN